MDTRSKLIQEDSENDLNEIQSIRDSWDAREAMVVSQLADSVSTRTASRVTDSRLTTIALEGSGRVMGQVAQGQVKALSKKDRGGALLLDIMLHRYVIPNDNTGWDHLTKLRMQNFYSRVYGTMPIMYDYEVSKNYTGPISMLPEIRNWLPQAGRVSIHDSDYNHVDNYVSYKWLESRIGKKGWEDKALRKILREIDNAERKATSRQSDTRRTSYVQRTRDNARSMGTGKNSKILVRTRYESGDEGRWITVAPDWEYLVLRDIKNPHGNGRIPIALKYNIPLIDSIFGLSDYERGKSIQFAMDSLTNLTLEAAKRKTFPPRIINPNGVVASSLTWTPGKNWLETIPNSIREFQSDPGSLNHFQTIYGFLTGALLNQAGTTDTTLNADQALDQSYGKTPQALKMLEARENTRDQMDRFYQEKAIEELYNGFISLITNGQEKPIDLHVFDDEIEQIKQMGYDNITDMLRESKDGRVAEITVKKDNFKGPYKYYVEAGSTSRKDDATQVEALSNLLMIASKIPQLNELMQVEGYRFSLTEVIRQIANRSGVESPEKIVYPVSEQDIPTPAPPAGDPMAAQMGGAPMTPDMMAQMQAMTGAMPNQVNQGPRGVMQPQMGAPMGPDIPLAGVQPAPQVQDVVDRLLA